LWEEIVAGEPQAASLRLTKYASDNRMNKIYRLFIDLSNRLHISLSWNRIAENEIEGGGIR
jgi:hypothetical protein